MTKLEIIDKRLSLFPSYLSNKIDNWHLTSWGKLYVYQTMGIVFLTNKEGEIRFNEWLSLWGYNDLVI